MNSWDWQIENHEYLKRTIERCRQNSIILPSFEEHKNPTSIPGKIQNQLTSIDLHEVHPLNLFRINWCNDPETGKIGSINHLEIPNQLSGVPARIIGLVGKFFPTGAHKVGATFGPLVEKLVRGAFDPSKRHSGLLLGIIAEEVPMILIC